MHRLVPGVMWVLAALAPSVSAQDGACEGTRRVYGHFMEEFWDVTDARARNAEAAVLAEARQRVPAPPPSPQEQQARREIEQSQAVLQKEMQALMQRLASGDPSAREELQAMQDRMMARALASASTAVAAPPDPKRQAERDHYLKSTHAAQKEAEPRAASAGKPFRDLLEQARPTREWLENRLRSACPATEKNP